MITPRRSRENSRLRARQTDCDAADDEMTRGATRRGDQRRHRPRHVWLHGAGTGPRPARRSSRGHVRFRRGALRDADRRARVQGRDRRRHDDGHPDQRPAGPGYGAVVDLAEPRPHRARCLEKTPDLRFQSANDLAFALETLSVPPTSTSASSAAAIAAPVCRRLHRRASRGCRGPSRGRRARRRGIVGVPAHAATARSALETHSPRSPSPPAKRTSPSLSPDGSTVAYAVRVNDSWDIYAQRVGGRNATPIVTDPQRDEARSRLFARRSVDRVS